VKTEKDYIMDYHRRDELVSFLQSLLIHAAFLITHSYTVF